MRIITFKFFTMAMIAMMSFSLTSCSSDDDEDNDGGSASSINNPLVKEGGLLITSITCQFGYSGDIDYDTYRFFYDEKLRPYKCDNGDDDDAAYFIIDYDNGKMDMPHWDGASNLSLSFNSKGYITKIKGSWSYSEDGDFYSGSMEWNASYDKDGHLTVMTTTDVEKSDDYDKGISKMTLSWTGGNLVSFNRDTKWYHEDGQVYESGSDTGVFTYGTQQNKYKQHPAILAVDDTGLFIIGLFGLGPNNLPISYNEVSVTEYEEYEYKSESIENYTSTSTFTLNDNGSIDTEIWTSNSENYPRKYMYCYSDVNSVSRGTTRSVAMTSTMSASDKAKRIRDFTHKLPFVPKNLSSE